LKKITKALIYFLIGSWIGEESARKSKEWIMKAATERVIVLCYFKVTMFFGKQELLEGSLLMEITSGGISRHGIGPFECCIIVVSNN
jgi:hypothetical protein